MEANVKTRIFIGGLPEEEWERFARVNPDLDRAYKGRIMDVIAQHAVLSLGRSAVIIDPSLLDNHPTKDQDVLIVFKGRRGSVSCEVHGHSPLQR